MRDRIGESVLLILAMLFINVQVANAYEINPVAQRASKEDCLPIPYIGIAFYKPNYILPFHYTGSPYNRPYRYHTPGYERIKSTEIKYQISLKVPVWKNIYCSRTSLYFAYTLRTYWQVYNKYLFIRETDYEPEFFVRNSVDFALWQCWQLDFLNVGYCHQSNGCGNRLQRSWDRVYIEAISSINGWMISLKPWYVIATYGRNENIADYLGYGTLLFAYKFCGQVFSFEFPNIGVAPKRTTVNVTWSFPITPHFKGYIELFSGYGQSLIEYNHHTNSIGIGFALNDWL